MNDITTWRPNCVKNLTPGLVERGKIKIGKKGETRQGSNGSYQLPTKIDHFIVTTMERGGDNNFVPDASIMDNLGEKPKEIPVKLVYDDIQLNFPTRYACYNGKTLWCTGDGEKAIRLQSDSTHKLGDCPCERQAPTYTGKGKCKITGNLQVVIEGADVVGGVWKFRTTSYNSVVGIMSSLAMIKRITGGPLAGIPLMMRVTPKAVTNPVDNKQQTIYVVSLEYRGSVESLQDIGHQVLLTNHKHGIRIEHIEEEAKALLTHSPDDMEVEGEDIAEEFFPEEANKEAIGAPDSDGDGNGFAGAVDDALDGEIVDEDAGGSTGEAIEPESGVATDQVADQEPDPQTQSDQGNEQETHQEPDPQADNSHGKPKNYDRF